MIRKTIDTLQALAKSVDELARSVIALTTAVNTSTGMVREVAVNTAVTREKVDRMDAYLRPSIKAVAEGG
jgi:hypothetical protein